MRRSSDRRYVEGPAELGLQPNGSQEELPRD